MHNNLKRPHVDQELNETDNAPAMHLTAREQVALEMYKMQFSACEIGESLSGINKSAWEMCDLFFVESAKRS